MEKSKAIEFLQIAAEARRAAAEPHADDETKRKAERAKEEAEKQLRVIMLAESAQCEKELVVYELEESGVAIRNVVQISVQRAFDKIKDENDKESADHGHEGYEAEKIVNSAPTYVRTEIAAELLRLADDRRVSPAAWEILARYMLLHGRAEARSHYRPKAHAKHVDKQDDIQKDFENFLAAGITAAFLKVQRRIRAERIREPDHIVRFGLSLLRCDPHDSRRPCVFKEIARPRTETEIPMALEESEDEGGAAGSSALKPGSEMVIGESSNEVARAAIEVWAEELSRLAAAALQNQESVRAKTFNALTLWLKSSLTMPTRRAFSPTLEELDATPIGDFLVPDLTGFNATLYKDKKSSQWSLRDDANVFFVEAFRYLGDNGEISQNTMSQRIKRVLQFLQPVVEQHGSDIFGVGGHF